MKPSQSGLPLAPVNGATATTGWAPTVRDPAIISAACEAADVGSIPSAGFEAAAAAFVAESIASLLAVECWQPAKPANMSIAATGARGVPRRKITEFDMSPPHTPKS